MIPVHACFTLELKRGSRLQHYEDRVSFRKFNNVKRYVNGAVQLVSWHFEFPSLVYHQEGERCVEYANT